MTRVACVLPYSQSIYRNKNVKDSIHLSDLIYLSEYIRFKGYDVRVFDYLSNESVDKDLLNSEFEKFNPAIVIINPIHRLEDMNLFFDEVDISDMVKIGIGGLLAGIEGLKEFEELNYIIPLNSEKMILDILSDLKYKPVNDTNRERHLDVHNPIALDEIISLVDPKKMISKVDNDLAFLHSSRGCWYMECSFCMIGAASKKCKIAWNPIDPAVFASVMKSLMLIGVKRVQLLDSDFIGPPKGRIDRLKNIYAQFDAQGVDLELYGETRADSLTCEETVILLKKIGIKTVFVGVDSPSNSALRRTKKGITFNDVEKSLKLLEKHGISVKIGWLIADPESTISDLKEGIQNIRNLRLYDFLGIAGLGNHSGAGTIFYEMHAHRGTKIYKHSKASLSEEKVEYVCEDVNRILLEFKKVRQELWKLFCAKILEMKDASNRRSYTESFKIFLLDVFDAYLDSGGAICLSEMVEEHYKRWAGVYD
ncbi:B12-binding domain-containing radical SAM protein [Methanolacinia paynteri]|uniref:B12-binding domain-containing radical SAM protein n=1 Tax=Methanolacinia paynteri TaxID=230356 RepID=UPI00064E3E9B|nr:radical SAM protein [Methanolacinia paynteri]